MKILTMQKKFAKDMADMHGEFWMDSQMFKMECKRYAIYFSRNSTVHYVPIYNALARYPKELKLMELLDG